MVAVPISCQLSRTARSEKVDGENQRRMPTATTQWATAKPVIRCAMNGYSFVRARFSMLIGQQVREKAMAIRTKRNKTVSVFIETPFARMDVVNLTTSVCYVVVSARLVKN